MDDKQKKHFRDLLLKWQANLIQDNQEDIKVDADNLADLVDRASQEEEIVVGLQTRTRQHELSRKIARALQKIEENTYGLCENCEDEISIKRLEADPVAELCIDCQEIKEVKEHDYDI